MNPADVPRRNEEPVPAAVPTGAAAIVGVAGFLMATYGFLFVLARGAALQSAAWVAGGLLLYVASGRYGRRGRAGTGPVNPFGVVAQSLRETRERVRSWEKRP